jgi:hypothetical protein
VSCHLCRQNCQYGLQKHENSKFFCTKHVLFHLRNPGALPKLFLSCERGAFRPSQVVPPQSLRNMLPETGVALERQTEDADRQRSQQESDDRGALAGPVQLHHRRQVSHRPRERQEGDNSEVQGPARAFLGVRHLSKR